MGNTFQVFSHGNPDGARMAVFTESWKEYNLQRFLRETVFEFERKGVAHGFIVYYVYMDGLTSANIATLSQAVSWAHNYAIAERN